MSSVDTSAGLVSSIIYQQIVDKNLCVPRLIVDIGANDGIYQSNSRFFLQQAWNAILIEPLPHIFKRLASNMDEFKDRSIFINAAVGDRSGATKIYRHPNDSDNTSDGGASLILNPDQSTASWECELVDAHALAVQYPDVGVLSVDAEGYDHVILRRWLGTKNRPMFIISENLTDWGTQPEKEFLLHSMNYLFWQHIEGNDIYIKL